MVVVSLLQPRPMTGIAAPLTPLPASATRNATTSATCAGVTHLPHIGLGHRGAILRRVDRAGRHAVDADAMGLELVGQALGQAQHGALGGGVGRHAARCLQRRTGADVDDAAAPGGAHRRDGRPAHVERRWPRLTLKRNSHCAGSAASMPAMAKVPTVLTSPSTRPKRCSTCSTRAAQLAGSVRSTPATPRCRAGSARPASTRRAPPSFGPSPPGAPRAGQDLDHRGAEIAGRRSR